MRKIITIILIALNLIGFGQNTDSLWTSFEKQNASNDTAVIRTIYNLSYEIEYIDPDTAIFLTKYGIQLAPSMKKEKLIPYLMEVQGDAYWQLSDLHTSMKCYEDAQKLFEKDSNQLKAGNMLTNIGYIYMDMDQFENALTYYQKGLKIAEKIGNKKLIVVTKAYIAEVYRLLEQYDKAIETYRETIEYYRANNSNHNLSIAYNNMGIAQFRTNHIDSAKFYYNNALTISRELKDEKNIANTLANLGNIYLNNKEFELAKNYFLEAYQYNLKRNDVMQLMQNYVNLSEAYFHLGQLNKSLEFTKKANEIAEQYDNITYKSMIQKEFADYYEKIGDSDNALKHFKAYFKLYDSIANIEKSKQINKLATIYETERKQLEIDNLEKDKKIQEAVLSEKESRLKEEEVKNQQEKLYRIGLFIGICLLLAIAGVIYIGYRNKSKTNEIISEQKLQVEKQKEEIEEAHKEIKDSIVYAKRIQSAILPPNKLVKEYLDDSFILYKPKDVVAGDFYWMETFASTPGEKGVLFAAADCTGHGVPGAMVSVVCNNALNRSVREHQLLDPGKILDKTTELVISEFEKSEEDVKDGMDIALCSLEGNNLKYAGANNPLWIIRNGAKEVEEIKANKQPVGKFDKASSFDTHSVKLNKGDSIYVFSDGFVDQFGGDKAKKYKSLNLKKFLVKIQDHPMENQKKLLDEEFENWKGSIEQIDDVCIIGLRF